MKPRLLLGSIGALWIAFPIGAVMAVPQDCLGLRANADVASCANRYAPGTPAARAGPVHDASSATALPVRGNDYGELITVPVVPARAPAPPAAPEHHESYAVDRSDMVNIVAAGVGGTMVLVLAGLAVWRLSAANSRACPHCESKIARSAHSCRHCFRAV